MSFYLLQEDGSKLLLEDESGYLLLEYDNVEYWAGFVAIENGKVYQDSWQMGERPNPNQLKW